LPLAKGTSNEAVAVELLFAGKVWELIMNHSRIPATLSIVAALALFGPAHAAPLTALSAAAKPVTQDTNTVQVRWGGWHGGWGGGWGIGAGLLAGALIGTALAAPYYGAYPYYDGGYYGYGYAPAYYPAYAYRQYWRPVWRRHVWHRPYYWRHSYAWSRPHWRYAHGGRSIYR